MWCLHDMFILWMKYEIKIIVKIDLKKINPKSVFKYFSHVALLTRLAYNNRTSSKFAQNHKCAIVTSQRVLFWFSVFIFIFFLLVVSLIFGAKPDYKNIQLTKSKTSKKKLYKSKLSFKQPTYEYCETYFVFLKKFA